MARSTLTNLILQLRALTDAGSADYTQTGGTAVYWDNDQMQIVLDRNRRDVYQEPLTPFPTQVGGGTLHYLEYRSRFAHYEATDGGTAVFFVEDSTGANSGTANWSADYDRGQITFGSNQAGTIWYLTGRAYDLAAAAAEVWRMKAGQYAKVYNIATDNHRLDRGQLIEHALRMADYYAGQSAPQVLGLLRGDEP